MDQFIIQGGIPLSGTVRVSGAKNASLPMMAASLATEGPLTLRQVPQLADVRTLAAVLESLGVQSHREGDSLRLEVVDHGPCRADYELVRRMRASICVLGPLLARRRHAIVSLPGGCNIGHRPIDLHLKGLQALGANIRIENGYVIASCDRLRGAILSLAGDHGSTVTGTCNVMTAATLAVGTTVIESAACEPEVTDLGHLLIRMGAKIEGLGTSRLVIDGVDQLTGAEHSVIPDRIEAATLMIAAAITRGTVRIENVELGHLSAVIDTLREIGVEVRGDQRGCHIDASTVWRPAQVRTSPYPGFPTDAQAQLMALLALTPGTSTITETVFPDRFMHVSELVRMGADIRREGDSARITGVQHMSGSQVMASDLRASAALVIAALAARGQTTIHRIYHLDRGYESLESKLCALGAQVERTPENS